jgi:hypothetical protein
MPADIDSLERLLTYLHMRHVCDKACEAAELAWRRYEAWRALEAEVEMALATADEEYWTGTGGRQ